MNTSLRRDAQNKIDLKLAEGQRERSRQRRRRTLGGDKEIKAFEGTFVHKSVGQESDSDYDLNKSSASSNSLADSEVYDLLQDEMENTKSYIKRDLNLKLT